MILEAVNMKLLVPLIARWRRISSRRSVILKFRVRNFFLNSLTPSSKPNLLKLPFVVPMPTMNSATETALVGRPRASSSFAKAFAKAWLVDRRLPRRLPAQYQHECFCREATCSTCTLYRWSSCWGCRGTRLSPSSTPCTSPLPPK